MEIELESLVSTCGRPVKSGVNPDDPVRFIEKDRCRVGLYMFKKRDMRDRFFFVGNTAQQDRIWEVQPLFIPRQGGKGFCLIPVPLEGNADYFDSRIGMGTDVFG